MVLDCIEKGERRMTFGMKTYPWKTPWDILGLKYTSVVTFYETILCALIVIFTYMCVCVCVYIHTHTQRKTEREPTTAL